MQPRLAARHVNLAKLAQGQQRGNQGDGRDQACATSGRYRAAMTLPFAGQGVDPQLFREPQGQPYQEQGDNK
ncbi:MAG: hypothetical protein ACO3KY_02660 [Lysobacterales bacterium]